MSPALYALALLAAAALLCIGVSATLVGMMTVILDDHRRAQQAGIVIAAGGIAAVITGMATLSDLVLS